MPTVLMTSPGSHHCRRVAMLIHELKLDVTMQNVDVRPPGMGGENESPEFKRLNPNAKVPVLRDGDFVLTESNAIMTYPCEKHGHSAFWPEELAARARIQSWQYWQAAHLSPTADGLLSENMVSPMMGREPDAAILAELTKSFHRWADVLDDALGRHDYLTGSEPTCADLSVVTALMYAAPARIPTAEHAVLSEWLKRMHARDSWIATTPPPMPT